MSPDVTVLDGVSRNTGVENDGKRVGLNGKTSKSSHGPCEDGILRHKLVKGLLRRGSSSELMDGVDEVHKRV